MAKSKRNSATSAGDCIQTQSELAKLLDRDKSRVTRWLRDSRWPFERKAPWRRELLPDMLRWVAEELGNNATAATDSDDDAKELRKQKLREEINVLQLRAIGLQQENEKRDGQLLPVDEVRFAMSSAMGMFRNVMLGVPSQIVPQLEGRDAAERQQILDQRIRDALTEMESSLRKLCGGDAPAEASDAKRVG